jgi:hypothetical protein
LKTKTPAWTISKSCIEKGLHANKHNRWRQRKAIKRWFSLGDCRLWHRK